MSKNDYSKNKSKRSFPLFGSFGTRSISRDLTIGLLITVTAVSTIVISISYFNASRNARIQLENKAGELIISLSNILDIPLWNIDEETIKDIGTSYAHNEFIVKLKIVDSRGKVYFEMDKGIDAPMISRSKEILHKGKPTGHVELSLTLSYYKDISQQFMWSSTFTILINLITLIIMIRFLLRRFLQKPLNYFSDIVNSYASGKYDSSGHRMSFIEFQPLVAVLGEMGDRIKSQMTELRKHRDHLEELVKKRTAELRQAKEAAEEAKKEAEMRTLDLQKEVSIRKKTEEELQNNIQTLERFRKMAVGREKQMIKLKEEINELLINQGREKKYKIVG